MAIAGMLLSWLLASAPQAESGCAVVVHVEASEGRPLPEDLWVRAAVYRVGATARPLTEGSARLQTPCGPVRIDVGSSPVEADGFALPSFAPYGLRPIVGASTVTEPGRDVVVSLVLPETGIVDLEALSPDGTGVLGLAADLHAPDDREDVWLRTGPDGRARLRLPVGAYRLSCSHPDLQRLEVDGSILPSGTPDLVPVTLTAKGVHIAARFAGPVGLIHGVVKTAQGAGLPRIQVNMRGADGRFHSGALTGEDGRFQAPAVRPPVEVVPPDSSSWIFEPASVSCPSVPCQASFTALSGQDVRL
ncbi:MAG TPA: hypothetical protein VFO11_05350, partial [Candidatus Polarisedimenticolaceae bacterium]|nr:hypothetical protein [Candidatus Polarisedimenticolaceae bacterium]